VVYKEPEVQVKPAPVELVGLVGSAPVKQVPAELVGLVGSALVNQVDQVDQVDPAVLVVWVPLNP
jgi:hypothetical protein